MLILFKRTCNSIFCLLFLNMLLFRNSVKFEFFLCGFKLFANDILHFVNQSYFQGIMHTGLVANNSYHERFLIVI